MSNRLRVSIIFAAFGAMTAIATFVYHVSTIDLLVVEMTAIAAVAAALTGALFGNTFGQYHPMLAAPIGALAMLLAHFPFSVLAVSINMSGSPDSTEFIEAFSVALLFGWYFAGLFEVGFGAVAGWLAHRMTRPQE